eukprot:CAMPEP_0119334076 /NCGR_PEP_ID=MMETSP1333-20130426/86601_1 /TAXON_ID=418940 /ORGANISM="Scyphosphaera apsteinii, Strain RCC1455" /LENGTH=241 /DNA_ID=CAMNT_0007344297 /DNA_START=85 /DNA_END=807 /DNA_ORIENTATION=+
MTDPKNWRSRQRQIHHAFRTDVQHLSKRACKNDGAAACRVQALTAIELELRSKEAMLQGLRMSSRLVVSTDGEMINAVDRLSRTEQEVSQLRRDRDAELHALVCSGLTQHVSHSGHSQYDPERCTAPESDPVSARISQHMSTGVMSTDAQRSTPSLAQRKAAHRQYALERKVELAAQQYRRQQEVRHAWREQENTLASIRTSTTSVVKERWTQRDCGQQDDWQHGVQRDALDNREQRRRAW